MKEDDEFEDFEEEEKPKAKPLIPKRKIPDNFEEELEEEPEEEVVDDEDDEDDLDDKHPQLKPQMMQKRREIAEPRRLEPRRPEPRREPEPEPKKEPEPETKSEPEYIPVPRVVSMETMLNEIYDRQQQILQLLMERK